MPSNIYLSHLPVPCVGLECAEQMRQCLRDARRDLVVKQDPLFPEEVFYWGRFPPVHFQPSPDDLYGGEIITSLHSSVHTQIRKRSSERDQLGLTHVHFDGHIAPLPCRLLFAP